MRELLSKLRENRLGGVIGALLAAFVGLVFLWSGLGEWAAHLSYDLACLRNRTGAAEDVVVVEMDELAYRALRQDYDKLWDRSLHARLLERLQDDGARLVVVDVFLGDAGTNSLDGSGLAEAVKKNRRLAEAIRGNPRVVLAADWVESAHPGVFGGSVVLPFREFEEAVSNRWGIAKVEMDSDLTVRRHYAGTTTDPSLPWRAAELLGAAITKKPEERFKERGLRYYGPSPAFRHVSYHTALEEAAGFYRDKMVFIGGRPRTLMIGQQTDVFRTPYMRWRPEYSPGVEIVATTVLNLWRGDWRKRMTGVELLLIVAIALLAGFGLVVLHPLKASLLAIAGALILAGAGLWISWSTPAWFSWVTISGFEIPAALLWSVLWNTRRLQQEKRALEESLARSQAGNIPFFPPPSPAPAQSATAAGSRLPSPAEAPTLHAAPTVTNTPPPIPNHRLLRCIGRGGYGEVWLALSDLGLYQAVKVIYRQKFSSDGPYEREFRGLQQFTPISRNHAGLVHILHVGRNDAQGNFFYIMELGDPVERGPVNPETYVARSLATDLERRPLAPHACIDMCLHLSAALDYLHQQNLVHRDIKPSNIIFVAGHPKFADIGLVTAVTTGHGVTSYVGTQGYIAPEGPGRPPADVFSLGMVLFEAWTGRPVHEFPAVPTSIVQNGDATELVELKRIMLKACTANVERRYRSAAELHRELLKLKSRMEPERPQSPEPEAA